MLSVKQSVTVQDRSPTGNNNELKEYSVRDANSQNRPKKWYADTQFRARNLDRPREEIQFRARKFLKPREEVLRAVRNSAPVV
jgi:hypothetical protein